MAYYVPQYGEAPALDHAVGSPADGTGGSPAPAAESSAPPRVWTPGLMIAAIALFAAWWLRKH